MQQRRSGLVLVYESIFPYLYIASVHFLSLCILLSPSCLHCFSAAQAPYLAQDNERINLRLTHFIPQTLDLYQTLYKKDVVIHFIKTIVTAVSRGGGSVVFLFYIQSPYEKLMHYPTQQSCSMHVRA